MAHPLLNSAKAHRYQKSAAELPVRVDTVIKLFTVSLKKLKIQNAKLNIGAWHKAILARD
jgi:hypothetical protein